MGSLQGARRLLDGCGCSIDYLRLSVTYRCDLRCHYCMPRTHRAFARRERWLSSDEIERVVRIFSELGVQRVRLAGGEPLTRPDIVEIAQRI